LSAYSEWRKSYQCGTDGFHGRLVPEPGEGLRIRLSISNEALAFFAGGVHGVELGIVLDGKVKLTHGSARN